MQEDKINNQLQSDGTLKVAAYSNLSFKEVLAPYTWSIKLEGNLSKSTRGT
jgi:hypothetical protein